MMSKADNPAAHTSRSHHPHDPKIALSSGSLADAEVAAQTFLDILDLHQGPGVYLVLAPSGEARQRLMARWQDMAQARGYQVVTVPYTPQSRALDILNLAEQTQPRYVIFVDLDDELSWATANPTGLLPDLDQRVQQARQSLQSLNLARERLRQLPAPLFFWMSPEVLRAFALYAADLFAVRSGLLDVLGAPPAQAQATASDIERPETKIPWLTHYGHLSREEREGRLRLLLEALEGEARRSQPNLYRLARYYLDAAEILGSLEQYERALHHAQQALTLARKVNDPALLAASWLAIGQGLAALGRYDEALRAIQEAVDLYRDLAAQNPQAFRPDLARALVNLGYMLSALGRHQEAIQVYRQALDLYQQVGSRLGLANTLQAMGNVLQFQDDLEQAMAHYQQALDLYQQVGDRLGLANTLQSMGKVLQFQKDLEQAMAHYRQALDLYQQVGSRLGLANTLQAMGNVLQFQDDLEQAMAHYQQALDLYQQMGDRLGLANTLQSMGKVLQFQKDLEQAMTHYRQALDLYQQVGDRLGLANTLQSMGKVLQFQKDLEQAIAHRQKAVRLTPKGFPELLRFLNNLVSGLSAIYTRIGDPDDFKAAIRAWQETLRSSHLPSDLREKIQADILQAVQNIEDEDTRAELQAALAPYLSEESRLQRPDDEETRTIDAHRGERTDTDLSGS